MSTVHATAGRTAAAARSTVRRRRAPRAPPYIRARCARFGRLSRANERSDSNRRHEPSLSTSTVHATAGSTAAAARCAVHRRRAPRAPPCRKVLSVGQKWRELEFLTVRISQNCRYPLRFWSTREHFFSRRQLRRRHAAGTRRFGLAGSLLPVYAGASAQALRLVPTIGFGRGGLPR